MFNAAAYDGNTVMLPSDGTDDEASLADKGITNSNKRSYYGYRSKQQKWSNDDGRECCK